MSLICLFIQTRIAFYLLFQQTTYFAINFDIKMSAKVTFVKLFLEQDDVCREKERES